MQTYTQWRLHFQRMSIFSLIVCIILSAFSPRIVRADDHLAVIYPDKPAPYKQIYQDIISGVEDEFGSEVDYKPLVPKSPPDDAINWIKKNNYKRVIALGREGYRVAKKLGTDTAVVIGAVTARPNGISGISLITAPDQLFNSLKSLAPSIKTINVVYSPRNKWLIEIAKQDAELLGFTLNMIEVKTVKSALKAYTTLLKKINPITDSVWLPLDPITSNEQVILPKLLEESWERNLVLFSSKPAHAKRGVLFSLYPDHKKLGSELAKMVTIIQQTKLQKGVSPIKDTKLAVNLRTAAHLGFDYKKKQVNEFYLTFPE